MLLLLAVVVSGAQAQSGTGTSPVATQVKPRDAGSSDVASPESPNQSSNAFARYSGYRVRSIRFKNAQRLDQEDLLELLPLQPGAALEIGRAHV